MNIVKGVREGEKMAAKKQIHTKMVPYLEMLEKGWDPEDIATELKLRRGQVWRWRKTNPAFNEQFENIMAERTWRLELRKSEGREKGEGVRGCKGEGVKEKSAGETPALRGGEGESEGEDGEESTVGGCMFHPSPRPSPTRGEGEKGEEVRALMKRCETDEELHEWVEKRLKIVVPRKAVCVGHCAPFEYVRRAYFGGEDLVVWAPRGGGKTRLAAAVTLMEMLHRPGVAVRILGGSMEQALRMWEHLRPDIEELGVPMRHRRVNSRRIELPEGSTAAVVTQSQYAVRGLRVQKLRCDEVDMFDRRVWEAAQFVTKSKRCGEVEVAATVEALSTYHKVGGVMEGVVEKAEKKGTLIKWCLMEVLEACPKERECETCPLLAECGKRAKTECHGFFKIDDAIRIKERVSRESWETEMMCLRPRREGAVFPYFDEKVHVQENSPFTGSGLLETWLGIDFGFNDPFVCLWIQRDDQDRIYVIDEYVQSSRTMDEHIIEIAGRKWGEVKNIACDPAGDHRNDQTARSNTDLLKKAGYHVHSKFSNIIPGIEKVRAAVMTGAGKTSLHIHPQCKRLIAAMKGYHYPEKGGEQPAKDGTHDHLIDALRYYFVNFTRGERTGTGNY